MQSFEKWLDEEYTVAKLTLLSGQLNGKKLTKIEISKLQIEFDLLEKIHGAYFSSDILHGLIEKVLEYQTPIEVIAQKQGVDVNTVIQVVKRLTSEQAKSLMDTYGVIFTPDDLKVEIVKYRIRSNYIASMKDIKTDIESILPYIQQ